MSESRTIEASGPDIEAAITKGVSDLGVSRADVIVEILEEPARGLLGLGAKPAKVRLTLIRAPKTVEPISVPASSATGQSEQSIERAPSAGAKPPARASHDDIDDAWEEDGILSDSELAEDARVGAETLRELLGFLQMDARVIASRAESEDDEAQHWTLEIQGRDLGALIGRRGETLAALQYITRLIASRDLERRAHIVIDVEGYKARAGRPARAHRFYGADATPRTPNRPSGLARQPECHHRKRWRRRSPQGYYCSTPR